MPSPNRYVSLVAVTLSVCTFGSNVWAQEAGSADYGQLMDEIRRERATLEEQQKALNTQKLRLEALENRLLESMRGRGPGDAASDASTSVQVAQAREAPEVVPGVETVGEAPEESDRQPEVAILSDQGGVITKAGRFTLEPSIDYARADRNRIVFRGIEVPQSVLVGVFDINESRQDIVTASLTGRVGLTNRLEVNGRVPFIYRSDKSVLAPVANGAPGGSMTGTRDYSVNASNLGDVQFGARYQLTNGSNGYPYFIVGLQAIAPTGTSPFKVERDNLGNAAEAATGAGFWAVSPSVTALFPTDPAVIFGSLGYTVNFGRNINRYIGDTLIERVAPGGEPSATVGIGISLNPKTSVSIGYGHTWSFGTKTTSRVIDRSGGGAELSDPITSTGRDLQLGRYMFGISYRASEEMTINWNVEIGATDDASDVRTTLRIPLSFAGR